MAGFGYTPSSYGYYKPPRQTAPSGSRLLQAASGRVQSNPFGLGAGGFLTDTTDSARVARRAAPPAAAPGAHPAPTVAPPANTTGAAVNPNGSQTDTAPKTTVAYDVNTDPALQQVNALVGMNDDQARAAALKQKQDELLAYGDPNLIRKTLGDDTLAAAAAANPTSTIAQLKTQRDRGLHDLTEQLNQANLLYGGYRINQEQQAANDYQNALAQAAGGVNSDLGQIDAQLAAALAANDQQKVQAILDAYGRHATDPGATDTGGPFGGSDYTGQPGEPDPLLQALVPGAVASRTRRFAA